MPLPCKWAFLHIYAGTTVPAYSCGIYTAYMQETRVPAYICRNHCSRIVVAYILHIGICGNSGSCIVVAYIPHIGICGNHCSCIVTAYILHIGDFHMLIFNLTFDLIFGRQFRNNNFSMKKVQWFSNKMELSKISYNLTYKFIFQHILQSETNKIYTAS